MKRLSLFANTNALSYAVILFVAFLVITPIIFLIRASLSPGPPWAPGELSVTNFLSIINSPGWRVVFLNTILIGGGATLLAGVLGITLAWLVVKTDIMGRRFFEFVFILPMFVSSYIGAVGWILLAEPKLGLFNRILEALFGKSYFNIYTIPGIIIVLGLYTVPLVFIVCTGVLRRIDPLLEEAASVAGANTFKTMLKVTIPLATPGILAGVLLAFISSIENFGIPGLIGIPVNILTVTPNIWLDLGQTGVPQYGIVSAASFLLFGLAIVLIIIYQYFTKRTEKVVTIGGKGMREPLVIRLGRWRYPALALCIGYFSLSLLIPIATIFAFSFQPYWSFTFGAPTLSNYIEALSPGPFLDSLVNSLILATGGATLGIAVSSFLSYGVLRAKIKGSKAVDYIVTLPRSLPGIVLGVALLWTYLPTPIYGTMLLLILASVTRYFPFAYYSIGANLMQIHEELEDAARACGASPLKVTKRVLLPLLKNGLISGWVFLFVFMMSDVTTVVLLAGSINISSVVVFFQFLYGNFTEVLALSSIVMLIVFAVIFVIVKLAGELGLRVE